MNPDEFRAALADFGLTQSTLARLLEVDERTVRRWAAGSSDVPKSVALLFQLMRRFGVRADEL